MERLLAQLAEPWQALWRQEAQRRFQLMLAISASLHLLCALAFLLGPGRSAAPLVAEVLRVELVALPAPARRVAPPPPPPEKVLLPEQPRALPEPSPAPAPPPEVIEKPPPAPEQSLEDVLAQLRAEAGELDTATPPPPVAAPSRAAQPGERALALWSRRARVHLEQHWTLPEGLRNLRATVEVRLDAGGGVQSVRIVQRSGNPWFDQSVEQAFRRASPLPAPPAPGIQRFDMEPRRLR